MPARVGAEAKAMRDLWAQAVEDLKRTVTSPTAYRALEKTLPVAWEDGIFVICLNNIEGQQAAQLNNAEFRSLAERSLQQLTGDSALRFRIIEGADYEDWEYTKKRDAAAQATLQQQAEKRSTETRAFTTWDDIYDQVSRLWAAAEFRALPTGRARYFDSALTLVAKAMDAFYPAEGKADDATERGLARIVERIASMTGSDSALVAYLLFEKRKTK